MVQVDAVGHSPDALQRIRLQHSCQTILPEAACNYEDRRDSQQGVSLDQYEWLEAAEFSSDDRRENGSGRQNKCQLCAAPWSRRPSLHAFFGASQQRSEREAAAGNESLMAASALLSLETRRAPSAMPFTFSR